MGYIADLRSAPFALLTGGVVCLAMAVVLLSFPGLTDDAVPRAHAE